MITRPRSLISSRGILLALSMIIIVHLIVLAIFTNQHRANQHRANRNEAIQQIMNIIHVAQATPKEQLANAINTLHFPHTTITLSEKPIYKNQFDTLTYWMVNQLISKVPSSVELSLFLPDGKWLNIQTFSTDDTWFAQIFLLIIEAIVASTILFYAWSINRFTQPLYDFRRVADSLGIAQAPLKVEEYQGPSIVRDTARAMNQMQKRIQDLLQDRTQMLAAISHDLRTPITRLKLRASKINDPTLYEKTLHDLDEMEAMITEILTFAEEDNTTAKKSKLDLASFMQSLCDDLSDVGFPVTFNTHLKRLPFSGRPLSLKRAFVNLIQNAIKYGKIANVTLLRQDKKIIITIDDEGPGIDDKELEKVFSPFYRCDRSRSRDIAGTGLGLSVAKTVILAHKGEIQLKNRSEKGLRVVVVF